MKKQLNKVLISIMCIVAMCLTLVGCGGKTTETISYSSSTLSNASVGKPYTASIATATGAEGITYALKSATELPAGLTLAENGNISGTPTTAVNNAKFTIIASKSGATSAEAEFELTILEAGQMAYTFETEYIDVSNLVGGGISGSGAGVNMLQESTFASNKWYLGFTHKKNLKITFVIKSDVATTAVMKLSLGTELGIINMNPSTFAIAVNDVSVDYTGFNIKANSSQVGINFREYDINKDINLKAGENTISFTVLENEYSNGATGGPMFDSLILQTGATLSWTPITNNIA